MSKLAEQPDLDLNAHDWEEIKRIMKALVPGYDVWAFGSRAKRTAKPYSDLDLVVVSEQPLPIAIMADLRESFDESDLTIKVDIVDWAVTSASFRKIIADQKVVVQVGEKKRGEDE